MCSMLIRLLKVGTDEWQPHWFGAISSSRHTTKWHPDLWAPTSPADFYPRILLNNQIIRY